MTFNLKLSLKSKILAQFAIKPWHNGKALERVKKKKAFNYQNNS